jgi:hypothetical protein
MADEADRAQAQEEIEREAMIASARSAPFIPGEPGECERCGDDMPAPGRRAMRPVPRRTQPICTIRRNDQCLKIQGS